MNDRTEYHKNWYKKNREKKNASQKKYYEKNKKEINERRKPYQIAYSKKNRKRLSAQQLVTYHKTKNIMKMQVFLHYSNGVIQCACCGELEIKFLSIDHIEGRKKFNHGKGFGGVKLYNWLIKNNFPDGFQILCINCNWAKGIYKICPHQEHKRLITV